MTYLYISPMTGYISQDVYYLLSKRYDTDKYLDEYARIEKRRTIIPAVLSIEYETYKNAFESWKGAEIYDYLIREGYSKSTALSVIKLFAANDDITKRLQDTNLDEYLISYGMTYVDRLHTLGIQSISYRPSFIMGMDIDVKPIEIVHVPYEPPIIEYEEWRLFQVSDLINCETKDSKGKERTRAIELRGVFKAEKNEIIRWYDLGKNREVYVNMLKAAALAAESILREYAEIKGYTGLIEDCQAPEFDGIDLMESTDSESIDVDEVPGFVTECLLEIVDIDFSKIPFTDRVLFTGKWWESSVYYIEEIRNQVASQ